MRKLIAAIVIASSIFYGVFTNKDAPQEDEEEPPDISLEAPSPSKPSQEGALQTVLNVTKAEADRKQAEAAEYKATHERRVLIEAARIKRLAQEAEKQRKLDEEANLRRLAAEKRKRDQAKADASKPQVAVSRGSDYVGKAQSYEATFYDALCNTGCTGITASGHDVRNSIYYEGMRILAAPKHIPLHSIMRVTLADGSTFDGIVLDRGGDIGNGRLDILVNNRDEAYRLGRQSVEIRMVRSGK